MLNAIISNIEKNVKGKEQFGDLDVDERIILKLIWEKQAIKV
jgi:hypothetical protein